MNKNLTFLFCLLLFFSFLPIHSQVLDVNGTERDYFVHVPENLPADTDVPLIIALHYLGCTNSAFETYTQLSIKADQENFIVAYPQGIGNSWNADSCCSPAVDENIDDIGFITMLLDTLIEDYPVDTNRVYLAGFSNGAMLAHNLASLLSDRLAGVAAVGGIFTLPENHAEHPVPVIHFHALADASVKFSGMWGCISVDSLLNQWKEINGILAEPDTFRNDSGVRGILYPSPDSSANIILYTAETSNHAWMITERLNTTNRIWEFFETGINTPLINVDTVREGVRKRDYKVHQPNPWFSTVDKNKKFPLILAFHGWNQDPDHMEEMTNFSTIGNVKGAFVTYLHYVGPPPDYSWNYFMDEEKPDDIGYVKAVLDTLFAQYPIDSSRVFAVGFSDGCGMVNRLPSETNGLISATGTVGGMIAFDSELSTTPVRMIHFHASNDPAVSYSSVRSNALPYWLEVNNCDPEPDTLLSIDGYTGEVFTNNQGDSVMLFYTLPWNQHDWPVNGENNMKVSASNQMWKFFDTGMAIPVIQSDPDAIRNQQNKTSKVRVYPNPASEELQLDFKLEANELVAFRLYQSDGKLVYSALRRFGPGNQHLEIDTHLLAKGYYSLMITGNSIKCMQSVILY
ncbi:MAG: hypothetical protein JW801_16185 [Bacteroidales bacterium]|nr:hypothetical protein [Bacteroidales bacterium]